MTPRTLPGQTVSKGMKDIDYYAWAAAGATDLRRLSLPREQGTGSGLVPRGIPRRGPIPRDRRRSAADHGRPMPRAQKLLEDFNFDHQPAADRNLIAHLGTGMFLEAAKNVVLLGPPGTGKPFWPLASADAPHMPGTASSSIPRPGGFPA